MNDATLAIRKQIWIYTAALKTMIAFKLCDKYPEQVDMTIENLRLAARKLLDETRREEYTALTSTNVKA